MDTISNLLGRIYEFGQVLLWDWWIVVGFLLGIEPFVETFIPQPDWLERVWPKEVRRKQFRFAAAAAFIAASFMAFDDVNTRNRELKSEIDSLAGKLEEARHEHDINTGQQQIVDHPEEKKEEIFRNKLSFTLYELEERQRAISEIYSSLNDLDALSKRTNDIANLIWPNLIENGTRDTADKLSEYKK